MSTRAEADQRAALDAIKSGAAYYVRVGATDTTAEVSAEIERLHRIAMSERRGEAARLERSVELCHDEITKLHSRLEATP